MLRPVSAKWFEILAPRDECSKSIGNLGRTGAVEIEVRAHDSALFNVSALTQGLDEYRQLSKRYKRYWKRNVLRHAHTSYSQQVILERALAHIKRWQTDADPLIEELQHMEEEATSLNYCQHFLEGIKDSDINFSLTANAGPVLAVVSGILPLDASLESSVPVLSVNVEHHSDNCFFAITTSNHAETLRQEIKAINGRINVRPPGLAGNAEQALSDVNGRIQWLGKQIEDRYLELDRLHEACNLPDVLGDVICLEWFVDQVGTLEPVGTNLVWITGWTSEVNIEHLGKVLADAGVPALVHSPLPPEGLEPPQMLRNPWWAKPFEIFARAFGTPSQTELDPSPILSLIVPLLFGYMFADVGQGLVLFFAGFWIRRYWSGANLIIAGGAAATIFGLLFGSIFSYENVIPALLLHPLHNPLLTLVIPVAFGACLLIIGQLLNGLESLWRGEWRDWLLQDTGLILLYIGILVSLLHKEFIFMAFAGAAWFIIGHAWSAGHW